ncbi:hypothetical protein T440DRAFT_477814 [Plenodomus tracheiphilus IPT5]|uniref:Uncharacterized protein n=1 Tax=Plenodomus tracheiphilus IPT5 TaxID=1408161 RepID=A0A6A7BAG8_9PLEO|nr:hypothetical protein T440DRAFT_477814 [Plenodomus tracheiphilus IPT5]
MSRLSAPVPVIIGFRGFVSMTAKPVSSETTCAILVPNVATFHSARHSLCRYITVPVSKAVGACSLGFYHMAIQLYTNVTIVSCAVSLWVRAGIEILAMSYEPYLPQNSFPSSDWPGDINSTQEEQAQTHNVESISAASGRRGIQLGDLSDPNLQYNARTRQGEPIYFDSQPWHLSDTLELYEGETHDKKLLPEERKTNMSQASNRSRHYHANEVLDENNPSSFILKPIGGTSWSTANARGPKYRLNYERSDLIPDSWEDRATQFSPATSTFTNSPNVSEEFLSDSRQPETLSPAGDAPWSPFRMRNVTGDGSSTPYPYLSPDEGIWWAQHSIPAALESITDLDTISASESRHGNDDETISSWANTGPGAHTASNILSATETATSRSSMLLAPNHSSDYHPILETKFLSYSIATIAVMHFEEGIEKAILHGIVGRSTEVAQ